MFMLKANGKRIDDKGELEIHEIYITLPTIDECFEELVKYKNSSELYITVEKVYLVRDILSKGVKDEMPRN